MSMSISKATTVTLSKSQQEAVVVLNKLVADSWQAYQNSLAKWGAESGSADIHSKADMTFFVEAAPVSINKRTVKALVDKGILIVASRKECSADSSKRYNFGRTFIADKQFYIETKYKLNPEFITHC